MLKIDSNTDVEQERGVRNLIFYFDDVLQLFRKVIMITVCNLLLFSYRKTINNYDVIKTVLRILSINIGNIKNNKLIRPKLQLNFNP